MESFVKRAEDKIADMKSQLAEMKEVQNHPAKAALQNAVKSLEHKVAEIKGRLVELKGSIAEGCKNAVAAFKEKGVAALDRLASFFHIKSGLQDWNKRIDSAIKDDDKAVAKIEAFAAEYHSAGRALKNMARVAVGKQPVDAKKEAGRLTKALAAPYRMQKTALIGLKKSIGKAIASLEGLENTAAARRGQRQAERAAAKKPSLLG
jgi:predicted nuclease with TOPRIM domain